MIVRILNFIKLYTCILFLLHNFTVLLPTNVSCKQTVTIKFPKWKLLIRIVRIPIAIGSIGLIFVRKSLHSRSFVRTYVELVSHPSARIFDVINMESKRQTVIDRQCVQLPNTDWLHIYALHSLTLSAMGIDSLPHTPRHIVVFIPVLSCVRFHAECCSHI